MSAVKRYLLKDAEGYYFKSTDGDGIEATFVADPEQAYRFTRDEIAGFRRDYDHIKGRTILFATAMKQAGGAA